MKDGYYLSTYASVNKIGNLYHILYNRHDQNISLWHKKGDDVKLVHYWELERQSRIKHGYVPFYSKAEAKETINLLLSRYELTLYDMEEVWGSPALMECLDYKSKCREYTYHSLCHLFSSILLDSDIFYQENIIGLAVDLRSDYETEKWQDKPEYTGCVVKNGKIEYFHIESPAALWELSASICGMQEGTLMALATASKSKICNYQTKNDKSILTSNKDENLEVFNSVFEGMDFNEINTHLLDRLDPEFTNSENAISAGMKEIHSISIQIMSRQIDSILANYQLNPHETYLSISGGYGLNCPTNSYLMKKYGFKGFIAPPCINDSGQSLGIALYNFYNKMKLLNFELGHPFYGNSFQLDDEFLAKLKSCGYIQSVTNISSSIFVEDLIKDPIVWFDGAAEIGPRALGHRSILGDPRSIRTKDKLNHIKQRQKWRPVAPIILEDHLDDWFEDSYPSPFMLQTFKIRDDKESIVPAVLHHDKSARIQTLGNHFEEEKQLYSLIHSFWNQTGVPLICNTSLNDKGEPIIDRPEDAIHFALKKNINIVYINGLRIELKNHAAYQCEAKLKPDIKISLEDKQRKLLQEIENPYNLSREVLANAHFFGIIEDFDLKSETDSHTLNRITNHMIHIKDKDNVVHLEDEWENVW